MALHALLLDRDRMLAYAGGDDSVLPAALGPADRAALEQRDLAGLYRLGAHPLVVFHLSAILFGRSHYIRAVVPQIAGAANPFYDYYAQGRAAQNDSREPRDIVIVANGIRQHGIEWSEDGKGHLVVMLHGVGCTCWDWEPLASRLAERFKERMRIVALDHRGCGDSDRPDSGYTLPECAADVLAAFEHLGGGPPTLIGHSRGGWITAYIAGHYPESVRQIVLLDPARMTWRSEKAVEESYDRIRSRIGPFDSWDDAIAAAKAREPEAVWSEARIRALRFGLREHNGQVVGKVPGYVIDQLRSARLEDIVGPYLKYVSVPALVCIAKKSDRSEADKLAYVNGIRQSQVARFDTTHYMHHDAPDEVANCVGDFISKNIPIPQAAGGRG